jgi:hypothetical protein
MINFVLRVTLTALLVGAASTATADVCVAIDESRDTFAPGDRTAALLLVTTQLEKEGERVVPAGCAKSFLLFHAQLGRLIVVTMTSGGTTWQATAQTLDDVPNIYSQMVRSIVTGRPMTGLSVVDRTNVTSSQEHARRVHSDSLWYGRLGFGAVFADSAYGTPALGFGYRAELDSFAIDIAFLNYQFSSPGNYSSPRAYTFTLLKLSGLKFQHPQANRSAYYGAGLSYGLQSITRGATAAYEFGRYTTSWSGSGLRGELTAGYELARATSLRVFVQADATLPFYKVTSETRSLNGLVTADRRYAPSLVLSIGVGR